MPGYRTSVSPEAVDKLIAASFVAGAPTNVQFMVKDPKKYAATGGWGFAEFSNGRPDGEAVHRTCLSCHSPAKDDDFVFTHTLQFEVLRPHGDASKLMTYEIYQDKAAFATHRAAPSLAQLLSEIDGLFADLHGTRCAVVD